MARLHFVGTRIGILNVQVVPAMLLTSPFSRMYFVTSRSDILSTYNLFNIDELVRMLEVCALKFAAIDRQSRSGLFPVTVILSGKKRISGFSKVHFFCAAMGDERNNSPRESEAENPDVRLNKCTSISFCTSLP